MDLLLFLDIRSSRNKLFSERKIRKVGIICKFVEN